MGGQTAYSINIPANAYPGQLVDLGMKDILSAMAYAAAIVFGTLVITDETNTTTFDQLAGKAPAASGDVTGTGQVLGVAIAHQAIPQNPSVTNPSYRQYDAVSCLRQGRIWVLSEAAVTDGTQPYVRYTANTGSFTPGIPGAFSGASDSGKNAQLPATQAVFRGTTTAAGYAVVECAFV